MTLDQITGNVSSRNLARRDFIPTYCTSNTAEQAPCLASPGGREDFLIVSAAGLVSGSYFATSGKRRFTSLYWDVLAECWAIMFDRSTTDSSDMIHAQPDGDGLIGSTSHVHPPGEVFPGFSKRGRQMICTGGGLIAPLQLFTRHCTGQS